MIPIREDQLTEFIAQHLAIQRSEIGWVWPDFVVDARRLARLMLASEQMYEALATVLRDVDSSNGLHSLDTYATLGARSALAAAEGKNS